MPTSERAMHQGQEPDALTLAFAPRLRAHVALVPIEDEAILFEDGIGTVHQLNASAAALCGLFDGEVTLATLVDDLEALLDADRGQLEADVLALAHELAAKGLLEGVGPEPPPTGNPGTPDDQAPA